MKKQGLCLFVMLCAAALLSSCAKPPSELIIGEWKGTDHTGETASLVFSRDGGAKMIQNDIVLDDSSVGGKVTWRIDDSHDPMHLDLVITDASGETQVLPMIVRFISDTKLQLRKSDDGNSRPVEFSDADVVNQITLTKQ